jgi:hypothetical protein
LKFNAEAREDEKSVHRAGDGSGCEHRPDNPIFIDEQGRTCRDWAGEISDVGTIYSSENLSACLPLLEDYMYSHDGTQDVLVNCLATCKICASPQKRRRVGLPGGLKTSRRIAQTTPVPTAQSQPMQTRRRFNLGTAIFDAVDSFDCAVNVFPIQVLLENGALFYSMQEINWNNGGPSPNTLFLCQ